MRFLKLGFSAFGPFTGLDLDLSGGAPGGFHLVLGPNEAGKSSALRGVHDLLFGFPERTRDAHVHPSADLRIAAANFKIAYLPKNLGNAYFDTSDKGGAAAIAEFKGSYQQVAPAAAGPSAQVSFINTLTQQHVGAIVLSSDDPQANGSALTRWAARGSRGS